MRDAWAHALYGDGGFSVRGGRGPRHDFSTSATRGPALAQALAVLVGRLPAMTGCTVVDVGAGDGRLIADLRAALAPGLAAQTRFIAVELAPRPGGLPAGIEWRPEPPEDIHGLLIAHELLDTVPCEIVEVDPAGGVRRVALDAEDREVLGEAVEHDDAAWLERWWPISRAGDRADVGRSRDETWLRLRSALTRGVAVAVDYGHVLGTRPAGSTLSGWSRGRRVPPVPDGSCDLTAHVAFDSCRQPGDLLVTQQVALASLRTCDPGTCDPAPGTTPRGRLLALAETTRRRALLDPDGLGGYLWLVHATAGLDPAALLGAEATRETGP